MERTLVDGPVAKVAEHDAVFLAILGSPAQAHRQRHVAGDDGVAAEEIARLVEEMHRAPLAVGAAGFLAVELGKEWRQFHAAGDGVAMVTVGGDDVIGGFAGPDGTDGDGFLTNV